MSVLIPPCTCRKWAPDPECEIHGNPGQLTLVPAVTKCADVTWDMRQGGDTLDELDAAHEKHPTPPGTLIWQPKGGEGHLVVEGEEKRTYGWIETTWPVCECGGLDFEDHHWVVLRPARKPEYDPATVEWPDGF